MGCLRLCALLTAVAAFTTPPSELGTTALRGVLSTFERAAEVPFKVFGTESGAMQLLQRLRTGREPGPFPRRGDAVAEQPALERETRLRDAAWLDRAAPAVESVEPVKAASLDFETSEAELEARAAAAALRSEARRVGRASREAAWVAATGTNLKRLENAKAYVSPPSDRVAYVPPLAGALDAFAADPLDERSAPRDGGGLGLTSLQRQRVAEEKANGAAPQKTAELGLASLQRQRVADEEAGGTARQKAAALGLASLQRQRVAEEEANGAAQQKTAELGLASLQRQRVADEEANGAARRKTAEPGLASLQRQRVAEEEVKQTAQQKTAEPGLASLQRQRVADEEANGAARRKAAELSNCCASPSRKRRSSRLSRRRASRPRKEGGARSERRPSASWIANGPSRRTSKHPRLRRPSRGTSGCALPRRKR